MKTQRHAPLDINELRQKPTVSVERSGEFLGVSRAYAYEMAKAGTLPVIRVGPRRMRVSSAKLLEMLGVEA